MPIVMAIAKIKNFIDNSLKNVATPMDRTANLEPEIGLRIIYSAYEKNLRVIVLGARHLPQNFGFTRVNSYIVKIKLFPSKEKFETTMKNESWPMWNEEFMFALRKETRSKFGVKSKVTEEDIDGSKLIIATLYAILEDKPLIATDKKKLNKESAEGENSKKETQKREASTSAPQEFKPNKLLNQFFGRSQDKEKEHISPKRESMEKRRTVGATSIPLDPKNFVAKLPRSKYSDDISTGDLWKPLRPIASGITGAEDRRENKKGQVEMILIQEKSDKKDVSEGRLVLTLSRLRCSLQTMHEHEALKGQLYIKISVVDSGKVTHFWKSDRFTPTVSMKFAHDKAQVIANNTYEGALKDISFVVKFVSKNKMGKKTTVGHLVIGPDVSGTYGEQWRQAMAKSGQIVTRWQAFE